MAIVAQLTLLAFKNHREMAWQVHKQRQSRIERKEEKLTFHLIYILRLEVVSHTEEWDGNLL